MKSPMSLMQRILADAGIKCGTSTTRDWETVAARVEAEGLSFLTITLPDFCKDFEQALESGAVGTHHFTGFRKWRAIPAFLRGLLSQVFDPCTGTILQDPNIVAIRSIRQVTLAMGKINLPCSSERERAARLGYLQAEREVRSADRSRSSQFRVSFRRMSDLLWGDMLSRIDREVYEGLVVPKHGPGSTADRLRGNAKFCNRTWTDRLEAEFPFIENGFASWSQWQDLDAVRWLSPEAEEPVQVISVPKTLKTPRIIAMEPSYMQYMQQGLLERFVLAFQADGLARELVNHVDTQHVNQKLACRGSVVGDLATLDLSEASDRVSNQLVRDLLTSHPWLFRAVDACRSRSADLGEYGVIRLAKFASMGSALTFPMEALVFCTLVFLGIERSVGRQLTRSDILGLVGQVRVYGDDIIVPVDYVLPVIETLEANGLRVNRRKSFWNGKFRESCGGDYYNGHDVSVVRVRSMLPSSRADTSELVSTVALRNLLWEAGWASAVDYLDEELTGLIRLPLIRKSSPALGRWTDGPLDADRFSPHLHRPEVRAWMVDAKLPVNRVDGYNALLKVFLKRSQHPFEDPRHLEVSGRPVAVRIKQRWAPVA